MKPIVLTRKSGRSIYVNPDQITHFLSTDGFDTLVFLCGEQLPLQVCESPTEIMTALAGNRSSVIAEQRDRHEALA